MLISDLNLNNITSQLIDTIEENGNCDDLIITMQFTNTIIDQFNKRDINPYNINDIITLCDYMMIDDTLNFIINHSTPTTDKYVLNDLHSEHYKLPLFMSTTQFTNVVDYDLVEWLKYALENGYEKGPSTCMDIAFHGHLKCLQYAHENGCEWNEETTTHAAQNDHLECLKYAHENGCEWSVDTPNATALNNNLECLKYAHENGCEWTPMVIYHCLIRENADNIECLQYACENGCTVPEGIQLLANHNEENNKCYEYLNGLNN
jgi:hypothetical protein